ncbi:uncharacterized protein LOC132618779 isoform X2 [Lycium barbarum]|uniref:uncharacterized protein LOC132618779 isoform X2 n=1 Tax=Lycium barbarum TaxID=112863 RepID=UPI00293EB269|nr:uncharacterized protein LOC132618779 isoform X2 [Lycium barbarum]
MKITSDRLKSYDCHNLIAVELDTPNLIRFSYDCHSLLTFKLKASVSLVANISFASAETPDNNGYRNVANFLSNFNPSMAIELSSANDKVTVMPKDMRENMLPPLYGDKCVHVNNNNRLNHSVVDVVDSLLWLQGISSKEKN